MVAVTSGDLLPLLDDNGSGQYIKGRNSARDIRVGMLGPSFVPGSDGFTPRGGVLVRSLTNIDLKVDPQASPDQTVIVRKGYAIIPRTGQGAYQFFNEADQNVSMPAASGVNSRYDSVFASAYDKGAFGADAAHGPEFVVVSGVVSGSPTPPATPAGMLRLADVLRATNDNVIGAGEIADKRVSVAGASVARPMIGAEVFSDPGYQQGEMRYTSSRGPDVWTGSRWTRLGIDVFGTIASIPAELAVENSMVYHAGLKRVIRYTAGAWDIPYDRTPGVDAEIAADFPLGAGVSTLITNMTLVNTALVGVTHSSGVWTVQQPGWWGISFSVNFSASTGDRYVFIAGANANAVWADASSFASVAGGVNVACSTHKYLAAGAQFRCYAYSGNGGNATHQNASADITGMQATWLGA